VLRGRLRLVEALQRAVMPFIQAPTVLHRDPHAIRDIEDRPEGSDGALQHRGEGDMRHDILAQQIAAGPHGFLPALLGQIDIDPPGEKVLDIPGALAVANQDQCSGH
jgi:hypothetical protein